MPTSTARTTSRVAQFVTRRVDLLRPRRTQKDIAKRAGFPSPNMLSMIKDGTAKLPLDRVIALARALECETGELMRLAVEQFYQGEVLDALLSLSSTAKAIPDIEVNVTAIAVAVEVVVILDEVKVTRKSLNKDLLRLERVETSLARVQNALSDLAADSAG